jgi:pyruvate,water dikinase
MIPLTRESSQSEAANLQFAGGKGANLIRLAQAGFPVPGGFLLTTRAYQDFVSANSIDDRIPAVLPLKANADIESLELASQQIRSFFSTGKMPDELAAEIAAAYQSLDQPSVAVRSSATVEDLPGLSFAGQQETYLNVRSQEQLRQAVVDCWSSLWTARAIGYRLANRVPQDGLALAVVIQTMVESEVSGVLFTADPLTGLRTKTVIDAAYGLGEALVSGQVEPDHYIVDNVAHQIRSKGLGRKAISLHAQAGGGLQRVQVDRIESQALSDEQILALVEVGQKAAALFETPQDIEWAYSKGNLYILQSRPITSLYPTPAGMPVDPLKVMVSFGAIQGMLDPMTPLGRYVIQTLFVTGAGIMSYHVTPDTQQVLMTAGERLWINITPLIRNTVGRRISHAALGFVEPGVRQAIEPLWQDPRLQPERNGIRPGTLLHLARLLVPLAGNLLLNLLSPARRREMILQESEGILVEIRQTCAGLPQERHARLLGLAGLLSWYATKRMPHLFIRYVSGVASGMACLNYVSRLAETLPGGSGDLALEVTRGLPYNPTTEMDLALWSIAQAIRRDPVALVAFQTLSPLELADQFLSGELPPTAQSQIDGFMERYGGRGLGEIDTGRPRWREDPTHIFSILSGYLQIEDPDQTPDAVFARGARSALAVSQDIASRLHHTRFGWLKSRLARFFTHRLRELMGMRESPKFFMVRLMAALRFELLKVGDEFVQSGELDSRDDLFYLTFPEQAAFASGKIPPDGEEGWKSLIDSRREAYSRELLRRQIPRLLLSDGRAFYTGLSAPAGSTALLTGSPVSPGLVTGLVRIVLDPRQSGLLPGEILVCPGTDPSWTPLFLTAAGLIMEVGGMMTHGAVVAREYGIPAVVGVDRATTRLMNGQLISLNGSTGEITVKEKEECE